jgi:YVTN family beta-propeller protein
MARSASRWPAVAVLACGVLVVQLLLGAGWGRGTPTQTTPLLSPVAAERIGGLADSAASAPEKEPGPGEGNQGASGPAVAPSGHLPKGSGALGEGSAPGFLELRTPLTGLRVGPEQGLESRLETQAGCALPEGGSPQIGWPQWSAQQYRDAAGDCTASIQPFGEQTTDSFLVNRTLVLANNTSVPGEFQAFSVGLSGSFVWDPDNQEFYVEYAGYPGGGLLVYKGDPATQVGRVPFVDSGVLPWAWGGGMAYDSQNHEIYVAMWSNTVETIDTVINRDVGFITVGSEPSGIAIDPGNGDVYVTNWASDNASVINGSTNRVVGNFTVGTNPGGIAYDPNTGDLLVTDEAAGLVAIIDPSSGTVTGHIHTGSPAPIVYDPDNGLVYTSNLDGNNVTVINGTDNQAVGSITVGNGPLGLEVDPQHNTLYVANNPNEYGYGYGSGSGSGVRVVNLSTDAVIKTIDVNYPSGGAYDPSIDAVVLAAGSQLVLINASSLNQSGTLVLGTSPVATLFDSQNQNLYIADDMNNLVWVVDARTGFVRSEIQVGPYPWALALDSSLGELFVANQYNASISVINTSTNRVIATWGTGPEPWGLAFDPRNGHLFESNSIDTHDVGVFEVGTGNVVDDLILNNSPTGMVYDPINGYLYVGEGAGGEPPEIQVFNASSDASVTKIHLGTEFGSVYGLTLDSRTGNIYVADLYNDRIWIIDGTTDRLIANLSIPNTGEGIEYDPSTGQILLPGTSNVVIVMNDTTNQVLGSVTVDPAISDLAVDASTGTVWASSQDGTVSQLIATIFSVEVNTAARVSEVGVPVVFNATITGGRSSSSGLWTFGDGATSENLSTAHAYLTPGTYVANLTVTDPYGNPLSNSENITILPALTLAGMASPSFIDQGQSVNLTAFVGQGAPPYVISWTFGNGGLLGTSTTRNLSVVVPHIFPLPGVYHVDVSAHDQFMNRSVSILVTVEPSPTVRIMMSPTTTTVGANLEFRASVIGGVPPYFLGWEFGDGTVATAWVASASASAPSSSAHQYGEAGTYAVELSITDTAGESSVSKLSVDVLPAHASVSRPPLLYPMPGTLPSGPAATSFLTGAVLTAAAVVALGGWLAWTQHRARPPRTVASRSEKTGSGPSTSTGHR